MFKSTDFTGISKLNLVFWFSSLIILYYLPVYIELQRGLWGSRLRYKDINHYHRRGEL